MILGPPVEYGLSNMANGMVKCLECAKTFKHKGNATRHYNEIHLQKPSNVQCRYCRRMFSKERYLHQHLLTAHQISRRMMNKKACLFPKH